VRLRLHATLANIWPIASAPDVTWLWSIWQNDNWQNDNWQNDNWQGKPKYSEINCPSTTLSTINPTRPDVGSNPGRHDGKPATNRLSLWNPQRKYKVNKHTSSEIRTCESSVRAGEDISCLRPSSHCNCNYNCSVIFTFYSALNHGKQVR
jgi:hypothetical protein